MKTLQSGTQKKVILNALMSGRHLTSRSGFLMGIIRLTNRVNELRKSGVAISDEWIKSDNGKRYKSYFMTSESRKNFRIIQ